MPTTIRITLLSGTYGKTAWLPLPSGRSSLQLDYPPSPWFLLQTLLHSNPALETVVSRLGAHSPVYHLPYGQISPSPSQRHERGRSALGPADAALAPTTLLLEERAEVHVQWPVDLSAAEERLLNAGLAELRCLGRPEDTALWQVVPSMPEPNCLPAADGTLQLLCAVDPHAGPPLQTGGVDPREHWLRYRFTPSRGRPQHLGTSTTPANRAIYGVEACLGLPPSAGIAWTDRLHRALLQRCPASPLFAGLAAGRPLPEDQRAWYLWETGESQIVRLAVHSPQPFDAAELDALTGLRVLFGPGGLRVPMRLLQLDTIPPAEARCVRTATPMLLYTTPRPSKIQRSPAAQAIQTLLWGVGEEGKLNPHAFTPIEPAGGVSLDGTRFGCIRAWAWQARDTNLVTSRSDRRAASTRGYHAVLSADHPLPLLAVGWGRHFGGGRLISFEQQEDDELNPTALASIANRLMNGET